jgi:hypothetical protein
VCLLPIQRSRILVDVLVLGMCFEHEMGWVDTQWSLASVVHNMIVWYWAVREDVRVPVCAPLLVVD